MRHGHMRQPADLEVHEMHNAARCLHPDRQPSDISPRNRPSTLQNHTHVLFEIESTWRCSRRPSWSPSVRMLQYQLHTWVVLVLLYRLAQCAPLSSDTRYDDLLARSATSALSTSLTAYYGSKGPGKGPSTINLSDAQVLEELHLNAAARYARAAYCAQVSEGATWTCGTACDATPGTEVIWTFGDNKRVPYGR